MNSASKLQKRLALPFLLIFVVALLFCALGTSAHAGDVAGVSTHLWLTVTGDYDSDATFYVSYTDALGPHTKVYTPGMEIAAWTPVTITVVDHTAEHWTLDVDVQETWLQGVGGVTEHGDVFRVTGTNSVQVFATNFGLHYVNVHVALSELDDADNGGSGSGGSGGSGDNGGSGGSGNNGGGSGGTDPSNPGGNGGSGGSGDGNGTDPSNPGGNGGSGGSGDGNGTDPSNPGGNGGGDGSGDGDGTDPSNPGGDTGSDDPGGDNNDGNVPGNSDNGDNGGKDNGGTSPKTGDTRAIGALVILALLCAIVFAVTYIKRRKHAN